MDAIQMKKVLSGLHNSKISALVRGNHGIGKSAVIKDFAERILAGIVGQKTGFVDIRLSQNDVGDLKGIPRFINGVTFFAPASWFPVHPEDSAAIREFMGKMNEAFETMHNEEHGVLFFDEINRAPREVQQCAFQVVLDRKLGEVRIPDGWQVIAAINGNQEIYQVQQMDPALINRFMMIDFNPSSQDWFDWAAPAVQAGRIHGAVYTYLQTKRGDSLDPTDQEIIKATETGEPLYTRRSWTMLGNFLADLKDQAFDMCAFEDVSGERDLGEVAKGFLGGTEAIAFVGWVKTEFKTLNAEDIYEKLNDDKKLKNNLTKLVNGHLIMEMTSLANTLVEHLKKQGDKLPDDKALNIATFAELMPNEVCVGFFTNWVNATQKQATSSYEVKEARKGLAKLDDKGKAIYPIKRRMLSASSKQKAMEASGMTA